MRGFGWVAGDGATRDDVFLRLHDINDAESQVLVRLSEVAAVQSTTSPSGCTRVTLRSGAVVRALESPGEVARILHEALGRTR